MNKKYHEASFGHWRRNGKLLLIFLLSVLLSGCFTASEVVQRDFDPTCVVEGGSGNSGRLSIFLNLRRPDVPNIRLEIAAVEVLRDGRWLPVTSCPVEIDTKKIGQGQIFLGRRVMPTGNYSRVRITAAKAALFRENKKTNLTLAGPVTEIELPMPLTIFRGDSHSLFLNWDVEESLKEFAIEKLAISISSSQTLPIITDLAYVACPDIDTVYIIRTDKNMVYGSVGVPGGPSYLSVDINSNQLYVLAVEESSIKIIDLSTNLVMDNIKIPILVKPSHMVMNPDHSEAYVLDSRRNYLVQLDLQTGKIINRVRVGQRPQYLLYMPEQQRLAVSSAMDQAIYLLDPDTLQIVESISISSPPQGMLTWDNLFYIAEPETNTVSVYDLDSRRMLKRLNVGLTPRRLISTSDSIYVVNSVGGTASLLMPGQFNAPVKKIIIGRKPLEMATAPGHGWLYIGDENSRGLSVVDITSHRLRGTIELGATPLGMSVIQ